MNDAIGGEALAVPEAQRQDIEVAGEREEKRSQVEAMVILAKKFPRDEEAVRAGMMLTIQRPEFALRATYVYPRGGKEISGPSIYLAREMARQWGNIQYGFRIVADGEEKMTIEAAAWDLQSNGYVKSQDTFKKLVQRKVVTKGVEATVWVKPDERDLRELVGKKAAIQVRNCILQLMPEDFVQTLKAAARKFAAPKDCPQERTTLSLKFLAFGVTDKDLSDYIGHPFAESTPDELVTLRGVYESIGDGNSKAVEYFPNAKQRGGIAKTQRKEPVAANPPAAGKPTASAEQPDPVDPGEGTDPVEIMASSLPGMADGATADTVSGFILRRSESVRTSKKDQNQHTLYEYHVADKPDGEAIVISSWYCLPKVVTLPARVVFEGVTVGTWGKGKQFNARGIRP